MEFTQNSRFIRSIKQQDKKAWHITCSTHNSRYSQRMFDNYVKLGAPIWLSEKEELIITNTIAEIVENDKLSILAYNICGDHMHILLVCDNGKLPKIVQKIKSMSARACNIAMGRTIVGSRTREHAPSSGRTPEGGAGSSTGRTPEGGTGVATKTGDESGATREHAPLSGRTPKNGADSSTGRTPEGGGEASTNRGKAQSKLWTQKFGCREIVSEQQLINTIAYIRNNRKKHGLPEHNGKCKGVVMSYVKI